MNDPSFLIHVKELGLNKKLLDEIQQNWWMGRGAKENPLCLTTAESQRNVTVAELR